MESFFSYLLPLIRYIYLMITEAVAFEDGDGIAVFFGFAPDICLYFF